MPSRRSAEARFVGMHFFSPVPVMPLVELIRGAATTTQRRTAIREVAARLGKQVIVSADRPGFIVNRILMPFLAESMRAFEDGLGTAEDIDTGARIGLNHPMGPLELADFIGLDVCLGVMRVLDEGLEGDHFAPPRVLVELVEAGHLGQKTGRGLPCLSATRATRPDERRADPGGAPAPGDGPRVRDPRAGADRASSATRPSGTTGRSSPRWASSG